jgi:hypothetical protein
VFPYTDEQADRREKRLDQDLRFEPLIVNVVDHPSGPAPHGERCEICRESAVHVDFLGYFCADHIAIDPVSRAKIAVWGEDDNEEQARIYVEVSNREVDAVYHPLRPSIQDDTKPDGRGDVGDQTPDSDQLELFGG